MTPDEIIRPHLAAMLADALDGDPQSAIDRYIKPIIDMIQAVCEERDEARAAIESVANGGDLAEMLAPYAKAISASPGDCIEWNATRKHYLATSMRDLDTRESPTLADALEWLRGKEGFRIIRPDNEETSNADEPPTEV
jgi:hypothetical protein